MKIDSKLLAGFINRWQRAKDIESEELRKLSVKQKLQQLVSIIYMARRLQINFQEDEEKLNVRKRWVKLKGKK